MVDDGERVAVEPIAHQELTFEVDGPDLVRRGRVEGRHAGVLPASSPSARLDTTMALEDVEDRAACGPGALRVTCS